MATGLLLAMATTAALNLCTPFQDAATELYGIRQCDGSPGLPARFEVAEEFTGGGIAAVRDDSGWYYIDRQGRFVVRPMIFDAGPDYFVEDLSRFVENGKMGFIDDTGRIVVPAIHDFAFPFENDEARVGQACEMIKDGEHTIPACKVWSTIARPPTPGTPRISRPGTPAKLR
jgi:hypothetical protein